MRNDNSIRVCENIIMLAGSQNLASGTVCVAKTSALVHDMGRFPQFKIYGTYSDALSKNHGALGVGVLVKQGILDGLPRSDTQLILRAVALHKLPQLPGGLDPQLRLLARLLRDADKIDIYRVMKAPYQSAESGSHNFLTYNLPDDGRVSGDLVFRLMANREIRFSRVSTLNDMKLFQISMIQDLNFPAAVRAVLDMGVVEVIIGSMPESLALQALEQILKTHMERVVSGPLHPN